MNIMFNGRQIESVIDESIKAAECCVRCLSSDQYECRVLPHCSHQEYFIYSDETLNQKVFKLRRVSDGLFSTGGARPSFNKKGKTWGNVGHLKSSISHARSYRGNRAYSDEDNFEIVEYELVEKKATGLKDI